MTDRRGGPGTLNQGGPHRSLLPTPSSPATCYVRLHACSTGVKEYAWFSSGAVRRGSRAITLAVRELAHAEDTHLCPCYPHALLSQPAFVGNTATALWIFSTCGTVGWPHSCRRNTTPHLIHTARHTLYFLFSSIVSLRVVCCVWETGGLAAWCSEWIGAVGDMVVS